MTSATRFELAIRAGEMSRLKIRLIRVSCFIAVIMVVFNNGYFVGWAMPTLPEHFFIFIVYMIIECDYNISGFKV